MKNLLLISALFLGLSILSAQNQEKDKTLIRVEKFMMKTENYFSMILLV
ncbi:MAG: hypothetical protein ACO3J1_04100 [Flavobacteriaceae bacterium]